MKLNRALILAVFATTSVFSETQITGKITHEYAEYTNAKNALTKNEALGSADARGKDAFKAETSARIYMDGNIGDNMTYHVEAQGFADGEMPGVHDRQEEYTQRDPLREIYVDTNIGDWALRLGKQQVVWGTADGMKLLDTINPTDYSEMAQNQMEDSRIPVFMINAEKPLDNGGNFQFIISEPRENVFAGLDRNISTAVRENFTEVRAGDGRDNTFADGHSQGHPFIMKGVDSITGKSNGFLNIVPDLGSIAKRFYAEFCATGCGSLQNSSTTVNQFASWDAMTINTNFGPYYSTIRSYAQAGYDGTQILGGFAGTYDTNLINANSSGTWRHNPDSTFEYMQNTTFGTFDAMAGAKSQYSYDMPADGDVDYAMKYSNTTSGGTNYSLNYSYNYDKNPIINLAWLGTSGDKLTTSYSTTSGATTLTLRDANGKRYGAYGDKGSATLTAPTLDFKQTVERAHNIGGSFDTTIESNILGPVVLRGEALYQKDVYSPVMDLASLSIGDLPKALTMVKGDRFKYVLGVDITALTNMMVSLQFIQDRNLDYIDSNVGVTGNTSISLPKFTTDYSTMSLTNNFNKAEENKEFYSLYLSKPFGASGQHRWNNILMYEENDGFWNRLDAEYTLTDNMMLTGEYNKYWGNNNTQFGQLEDSSNIQVGVKYSF